MDQIATAAKMAGDWWAERLLGAHKLKKVEFSNAVAKYCEATMRENVKLGREPECWLDVDYDPQGPMLAAVREVLDPGCKGVMFSASGILPQKHSLRVGVDELAPKEGYGLWTDAIPVPNAELKGRSGEAA